MITETLFPCPVFTQVTGRLEDKICHTPVMSFFFLKTVTNVKNAKSRHSEVSTFTALSPKYKIAKKNVGYKNLHELF